MIALHMIMIQELANAVPQRIFSEKNQLIQTAFLNSLYETFGVRIQIWGPRRQFDRFNACIGQHRQEFLRIQRIAIMDEVPVSSEKAIDLIGHVSRNLHHPQSVCLLRHSSDLDSSCGEFDEEKNDEPLQTCWRPDLNREEVRCHDLIPMSGEKFFPCCLSASFRRRLDAMLFQDVGNGFKR